MSNKVLVFEHDAGFAGELRRELSRLGCHVTLVDDGNAGLQQAAAERPDLILLSIELPRMNGFSVCNKLKKDPQLKDVPLVIMSSESSDETFEQHKKLRTRAEDYVHKPIAFGELLQHMRALLPQLGDGAGGAAEEEEISIDDELVVGDLEDDEMTQVGQIPPGVREQLAARGKQIVPRKVEADKEVDDFADKAFDNLLGGPNSGAPPPAPSVAPAKKASVKPAPAPSVSDGEVAKLREDTERLERELADARGEVAKLSSLQARVREQEDAVARLEKQLETEEAARHAAENEADAARAEVARSASASTDGNTVLQQELERLRDELKNAREAQIEVEKLRQQVAALESAPKDDAAEKRAAELQEENQRLSREITDLRARVSKTPSIPPGASARPSGVSTRDFLELRESLNKKDKEILALKDLVNGGDKQLVDLRDKLFAQERVSVELEEKLDAITRQLTEANTLANALRADKEQAQKRGDDFSKRFERARQDAESLQKDLVSEREKAVAALSALTAERDQRETASLASLRAELESQKSEALAASDRAHSDELARLRAEHDAALADAQAASVEAREAAVNKKERELREEMETKLAAQAVEHAKALEAAERAADDRISELSRERDAKVAEMTNTLADLRAENERALADAEARRQSDVAETTQTLEAKLAATIADLTAKADKQRDDLTAQLDGARAELDRIAKELDGERHRVSLLQDEVQSRSTAVEGLNSKLGDAHGRISSLESDLASTRAKLDEESSRARRAHEKWERDRVSLERAKDALAEALTRIEEAETNVA